MIWDFFAIVSNPDAYEITRDSNGEIVIREIHDEPIDAGARRLQELTDSPQRQPHEVAA